MANNTNTPTIVLVHGGFADASFWAPVIRAQLAAQGLTNREIGQRLYLSHRTIATHLYRAFPKLGITARNELAAALAADGQPGS
jgi:pimeloyl-ACP methyl ester carboxylesterase